MIKVSENRHYLFSLCTEDLPTMNQLNFVIQLIEMVKMECSYIRKNRQITAEGGTMDPAHYFPLLNKMAVSVFSEKWVRVYVTWNG